MGAGKFGIEHKASKNIAAAVKEIHAMGIQIGIVVGGGNIFRGKAKSGMDQTPADHIGMLATLINGISLQLAFERISCESRIMSAIACEAT